ncbi:uncharacterized protein LOC119767107 [Culex quinquefasciatus]|uniref:uncharacterized protein LOC119767107 n=1 Tax=Culex quinquefasciatus TaxID=7176 RepID=UPI0018E35872|nr:uncharacterized protein LOC119767107 [Culex quinquefasciatus]
MFLRFCEDLKEPVLRKCPSAGRKLHEKAVLAGESNRTVKLRNHNRMLLNFWQRRNGQLFCGPMGETGAELVIELWRERNGDGIGVLAAALFVKQQQCGCDAFK